MPITFAAIDADDGLTLYSPLDEKPKTVADPRRLARVRDILERPRVSVLVDRWSEDWSALAWLRLDGGARLVEPASGDAEEHGRAIALLRERYPPYAEHALELRPLVRIGVDGVSGWSAA